MADVERQFANGDNFPRFPESNEADQATVRGNVRAQRTERLQTLKEYSKRVGGAALLGTVLITGIPYVYLQRDINEGKLEVAGAHPEIHDIYRNTDPELRHAATYVATGMGTRDSSGTAEVLTAHQETGGVYAIEYSNKEIDVYELADTIAEHAHKNDIRYISFDGYSAGGPISLAIAAEIYEKHADLHIINITLNSSPIGEGSLTSKSDEGGRLLSELLNYWAGLAYSDDAHLIAEVLARNDRYVDRDAKSIDFASLKKEVESVKREKIHNETAADSSLIVSQIQLIFRFLAENDIARLARSVDGKVPPQIDATYSSDPLADHVVSTLVSAQNVQQIIHKNPVPNSIIYIDNIGHANPVERPTEYNKAIFTNINPHKLSVLRIDHSIGGEPEHGDSMYTMPPPIRPIESELQIE